MTITREQVADLQPGDVVELGWTNKFDEGVEMTARGTLRTTATSGDAPRALFLAKYCVRDMRGDPVYGDRRTLTVVSRAPRPLYVNSDRTEPVPGDVVRFEDADHPDDSYTNAYLPRREDDELPWVSLIHDPGHRYRRDEAEPSGLGGWHMRLLVDGETGQVIP